MRVNSISFKWQKFVDVKPLTGREAKLLMQLIETALESAVREISHRRGYETNAEEREYIAIYAKYEITDRYKQ